MVIKVVLIKFYSDESSESANDDDLGLSLDKHNLGKKKKKKEASWIFTILKILYWNRVSLISYLAFSIC